MYESTIVQFGRMSLIFVLYSSLSPFSNRVWLLISNPIETAAKSFELEAIAKSVCYLVHPLPGLPREYSRPHGFFGHIDP